MILKAAIAYSGTNLIAQLALFVQGFLLRRLLVPEVIGIWNMVLVVRSYVQPASLGALSGAFRALPILRGRGDVVEEHRCRSVAFTSSVAEIAVLGLGVWGYAFWARENLGSLEFYALLVAGLTIILLRVQEAYVTFLQAAQLYVPLSRSLLINSLVSAGALPLGAAVGGLPGLLVAGVASEVIRATLMTSIGRRERVHASIAWAGEVWKRLVSYGVLYTMTGYPNTFFMALDLLWVTRLLDLRALGLYALARTFSTAAADITVRIGTVMYTRALTQYGAGVSRGEIADEMRRFVQFQLLVSVPIVACLVASVGPLLIRQIIPLYGESVPVMLVLLLGSFFISQNNNLFAIWIAERRLGPYGVSNVAGVLAVGASLSGSWWLLGRRSLMDVAIATVVGHAGYFAYMVFTAGRELWGAKVAARMFLQGVSAAGLIAGVFALFAESAIHGIGWREDLVQSLLAGMGMLGSAVPLAAFGLWASGGGSYLYRRPSRAGGLGL